MSAASSTAFSLWAILSILFLVFLVHHLWCYDRFKCLRWSAGQQGAFKRVMTYSYLGAVPLLAVYSVGMTVIKYREGFVTLPDGSFLPRPVDQFRAENRSWVLPLQFVFSFAWALEMVTHLEELAFWLYLLHQNPEKEAWFSSWEYRLWYLGSLLAIIGMPLTALITRRNLQTCDAYIFLVGASGSTMTTLAFLYVLWCFPRFIKHVKAEGADPTVVVRLATFYQLNQARVVFRFLFTIPLLLLSLDGIIGVSHPINHDFFATDFLQMIAGIGCFVSSMITLLIFFPRSIVREAGYKPKVSTTPPRSPKSPLGSPPPHIVGAAPATYPYPHHYPQATVQHFPYHMAGYVTSNGHRMSVTGGTGWKTSGVTGTESAYSYAYSQSMCSPRGSLSLYDSPQYTATAEDDAGGGAGAGRRGSKGRIPGISRRGSKFSTYSGRRMDAHPEQDSYDEDEEDDVGDASAEADVEDEERVPPYSCTHPHHHPHPPPPQSQLPAPSHVHLHQRHTFTQSHSSPQLVPLASSSQGTITPPHDPPPPPPQPSLPQAMSSTSSPTLQRPSPTSSTKRRTWDWEERRPRPAAPGMLVDAAEARRSLHVITTTPGVNLGLGLVSTALGSVGTGRSMVGRGGGGTVVGGTRAGTGSSLHPYVVNFTSPIDLVDMPLHEGLPRA